MLPDWSLNTGPSAADSISKRNITWSMVLPHASSLPEVTDKPHHHFGSLRVRGKIFVTMPPREEHIHVFVPEQECEQALAMYPGFTEKRL